jgi:putative hydrolase of the HAD superfamily
VAVQAVIFDWGGTLTPWHIVDHGTLWHGVCQSHLPSDSATRVADAIRDAERALWQTSEDSNASATLAHVFEQAGVTATPEFLASYFEAWDPHTITDPEAAPLMRQLRGQGIRVGVLSNTMWPRSQHERIFERDQMTGLIDGAVYSSEIPWVKPHPEAFLAVMRAVGADDPAACVFVGDRPYDDVFGAKRLGMRAVLRPNPAVPKYPDAVPDAVISCLSELPRHLAGW